jgi:2-polyprenyl-6-methoxyphenol hydroxylase-like FAD-dependent oxidoreductase
MTRHERTEFLVIGGGIGGLATALALAREGRQVRVLEREPQFGEIGAGLQLAPNSSRVLDRLGVLSDVTRDAFFPRRLVLRDAMTSDPITAMETTEPFLERFGYRYFVTHRADLHRAIQVACEDSGLVELLPSKHVLRVEPRPGGALVACADGSAYETTALIAADGLHSRTRTMLIEDGEPEDSGYVAYRGTVPIEALAEHGGLREPDGMVIWVGPGLHLVQYPVRRGELVNQVATLDTRRYPAGTDDIGRQLDRVFERTCPEVAHGVALMDRTRRWPLLDRAPMRGWSRGNITLTGDAAHPMLQYLAQGAGQAIEDSVALADSVAAHPGDIEAAFAAYESHRYPRTARVQTTAHTWGEILHIDGVGAVMRNALLSQRADDDFEIVDWLYGYDPTGCSPRDCELAR